MSDFDKFIDGIEDNNVDVVKSHFHEDFLDQVDSRSDNNRRPIHIACRNGNVRIAEYLINQGSNVDSETTNGNRAIHFAAVEGHADVARLLITHCCNIESETINGDRPIHYAAMNGHADVIRTLINYNCQLDPRNKDGKTPLALAKISEDEECINLLEEAVEDRRSRQVNNHPGSVDLSSLKELVESELLTKIVDPQTCKTILDAVLERNDDKLLHVIKTKPVKEEEVDDLLRLKEKIFGTQSYKMLEECLLYRCIRNNNMRYFNKLCTPDIVSRETLFMGRTALEAAAEFERNMFAKYILERLMKADESWERARQLAEEKECQEISDSILAREKYLKRREKCGHTRLHIAVYDNCPDMIAYILDNKLVSVDAGDRTTGAPISLAMAIDYVKCIKVLEKYGASADTRDKYRQTPLHIAISSDMHDFFDYQVEKIVDLEAKDMYGFTVLDRARKSGFNELCDKLIKRGAIYNDDPRLLDNEDYPLPTL